MPATNHIQCLHHLSDTHNRKLRPKFGGERWSLYEPRFWHMQAAPTPDAFENDIRALARDFPEAADYLLKYLYPRRRAWAWAWVSRLFTGGIRTTGVCEVENRTVKEILGPKCSLVEVFHGLNNRTTEQRKRSDELSRQVRPSLCFHTAKCAEKGQPSHTDRLLYDRTRLCSISR